MNAGYTNRSAFIKPQTEGDTIVSNETFVEINAGQQTNLAGEGEALCFTSPTDGPIPNAIVVNNQTGSMQDLATGFFSPREDQPVPDSYFTEFSAEAQWCCSHGSLILHAYIASGYKEMNVLKSDIQGTLVWEQDLAALDESTTLSLTWDPPSGEYKITIVTG
ncbi:hypothetical protein M405DRAFT_936043 [Rhizopogon salebrosus TDB-379]|nr:hypothetical protein M405DRAFT_936043 [Rhizopogon salebrosus TDB-379]